MNAKSELLIGAAFWFASIGFIAICSQRCERACNGSVTRPRSPVASLSAPR